MDDQNKRGVAPVKLDDRPSTADRVKQAQDMLRRMDGSAPAAKSTPAAPVNKTQAPEKAAAVFDVGALRTGGAEIKIAPKTDPAVYARAQVDATKLFGGADLPELVGNPWKVISFETMLPVVFDNTPKPLNDYQASVPNQAAKTEQGLLFPVKLEAKGEAPIGRAVLTNAEGKLTGAECKSTGEVNKLLKGSQSVFHQLLDFAFGGADKSAGKLVNVAPSRSGAFADVTLSRGGETKTISVNNFARPIAEGMDPRAANLIVARYFSDRFDAA